MINRFTLDELSAIHAKAITDTKLQAILLVISNTKDIQSFLSDECLKYLSSIGLLDKKREEEIKGPPR